MEANRTYLFCPGNHPRKVEKVFVSGTDVVILDLEDAVAISEKPATRVVAVEALKHPRRCRGYVRVNAYDTEFCYGDISEIVGPWLDGIVLPKLESVDDLSSVDWLVGNLERERGMAVGSIDIMPIIETAKGQDAARDIAVRANADADWAWIVDTNGDVYSHSDTYDAAARLGNAFTDSVDALLDSPARGRVLAGRAERARACEACEFGNSCTRLPMVEAVPSERHGQASTPEDCRSVRPLLHWLSASARRGTRLAAGA